jgi:hypothetical protein
VPFSVAQQLFVSPASAPGSVTLAWHTPPGNYTPTVAWGASPQALTRRAAGDTERYSAAGGYTSRLIHHAVLGARFDCPWAAPCRAPAAHARPADAPAPRPSALRCTPRPQPASLARRCTSRCRATPRRCAAWRCHRRRSWRPAPPSSSSATWGRRTPAARRWRARWRRRWRRGVPSPMGSVRARRRRRRGVRTRRRRTAARPAWWARSFWGT